jgi:site-specific DNA-methyltransferase (adenine-specific)
MPSNHRIIFGDSRKVLNEVKAGSVALVVTSPPYFVGREYETYIEDENAYWKLLRDVLSKLEKVVEPYGKVAINFPDRYANHKYFGYPAEVLYAERFDSIMRDSSFDLWARIIWDKNKVFIDGATHLASPSNKTGQMRVAPNWEYIFVWRKHSQPAEVPKKNVLMSDEERIAWTDSIWTMDSVTVNEEEGGFKLAKFPEQLPYRLIKMYCEESDTVLDPFAGTCTVAKVATNLGCNSICIEKNPVMENYIKEYLQPDQLDMFNADTEILFIGGEENQAVYGRDLYPDDDYNYALSDFLYDANREREFFG